MCAIRAKKRTNFYYGCCLTIGARSSVPSRCSGATWAGAKPLAASKRLQLNDNGHAAPEISGPEITRITQIGRTTHESLGRTRKWLAGGHQRAQQGHQVGLTLGRRLRLHRKAFGAVARHSRGVTKSDGKNPSIPRIRQRFHNHVGSPQSGLSQLCHLRHTTTGHMCQCARARSDSQAGGGLTPRSLPAFVQRGC